MGSIPTAGNGQYGDPSSQAHLTTASFPCLTSTGNFDVVDCFLANPRHASLRTIYLHWNRYLFAQSLHLR
eukprot:c19536_g2_i1 orf=229-438(+)